MTTREVLEVWESLWPPWNISEFIDIEQSPRDLGRSGKLSILKIAIINLDHVEEVWKGHPISIVTAPLN